MGRNSPPASVSLAHAYVLIARQRDGQMLTCATCETEQHAVCYGIIDEAPMPLGVLRLCPLCATR